MMTGEQRLCPQLVERKTDDRAPRFLRQALAPILG